MCGISGIWHLTKAPVAKEKISRFNDSISHRGPDGYGIYIDDSNGIALGHRRLSILDLTDAGKQPMHDTSETLVITYNGEIYNYLELKEELTKKGHQFKTRTDTEVILAAYREWGEQCLNKFNGMWAFAIWDTSSKALFISRDRFGVKPLYYVYLPQKLFAFASESISFSYLEGFEKHFDSKNVNLGIRDPFYLESVGQTIYQHIEKLKPGHWLKMSADGILQIEQWWYTEDHLQVVSESYEEQTEKFRALLFDSCRLRLRSDVPIGIALSGGIDSTAVYCSIQAIKNSQSFDKSNTPSEWDTAFVASFPGTAMDEKHYADEVVNYTNGKVQYIYPDSKKIVEEVISQTRKEDFIYLSPPVIHSIYREMRTKGVKVSLDGHGVDEMLFGYPDMIAQWVTNDRSAAESNMLYDTYAGMLEMNREEAIAAFAPQNGSGRSVLQQVYDRLVPGTLKNRYRQYSFEKKKRTKSWWLQYHELPVVASINNRFNNIADYIPYHEFHTRTLPTLLRNWDRGSMQHGVEIRMPFMDWRLVSYVFSLPPASKVGDGFSKRIVRDAMKGFMPNQILSRRSKIGINAPMSEWFNGPLSRFILDTVHSKSFENSSIWNGKLLKEVLTDLTLNKKWTTRHANALWPYLNAYILSSKD